jgi:uncharacterized protein YjiS (DUF1127 family)
MTIATNSCDQVRHGSSVAREIEHARPRLWKWLATMVAGLFERVQQWEDRANAREFFLRIDDHTLRDIGLTRQGLLRTRIRRR